MKNNLCAHCLHAAQVAYGGFLCEETGYIENKILKECCKTFDPDAETVRNGRWIECDYKHIEHGMIKKEPKEGLCCSNCRTAFQKKKMTYKQFCAACGAKMDAEREVQE